MCKLIKFMLGKYQESETNEEWMEQFHRLWEAIKQHSGSHWTHPLLIQDRAQQIAGTGNMPNPLQFQQAESAIESEMKTMFMLARANKARHEDL
jgi:hypothetical protein